MMGSSQQPFFPFGASRPGFSQPQNTNQDQFGSDSQLFNKPLENMGGLPMNRPSNSAPSSALPNSQNSDNRFSSPRMGGGDGMGMPFGPGFPSMFRPPHPGSGFAPPPNFSTPPPDQSLPRNQSPSQGLAFSQRSMGGLNLPFSGSGFHGNSFSHAPGTERPQGGRDSGQQPQTPPQVNFQQVSFVVEPEIHHLCLLVISSLPF